MAPESDMWWSPAQLPTNGGRLVVEFSKNHYLSYYPTLVTRCGGGESAANASPLESEGPLWVRCMQATLSHDVTSCKG